MKIFVRSFPPRCSFARCSLAAPQPRSHSTRWPLQPRANVAAPAPQNKRGRVSVYGEQVNVGFREGALTFVGILNAFPLLDPVLGVWKYRHAYGGGKGGMEGAGNIGCKISIAKPAQISSLQDLAGEEEKMRKWEKLFTACCDDALDCIHILSLCGA